MKNIFTEHPKSVGESYFKHLFKAFRYSFILFSLSCRVFIHAIFPFLFKTYTSKKICELNDELQKRKDFDTKGSC